MHIRGWLTGLIVFLLAPSLLFASLWFYGKFESVQSIERSQDGLKLIQALGPLMREKAVAGQTGPLTAHLENDVIAFAGPELGKEFRETLQAFVGEPAVSKSLRTARELTLAIGEHANLASSVTSGTTALPHLLTDGLLSVVIETSKMRDNAQMLSKRESINVWDKMLIPVQGGQFKVAADGVSRDTVKHFSSLTGPTAEELRQKAKNYRQANVTFQSQGAKFLTSAIKGTTGTDIVSSPVIAAHPEFAAATFTLWQEVLGYLDQDLAQQRTQTLQAVALAGAAGSSVILIAFGIGAVLVRALADRTQKEFEELGFHDPLTGLPNRRALLKALTSLCPSGQTGSAGLMVFDIRQFRSINHQFGDKSGDALLRAFAAELTALADPADFLSRTGGSEFVLFRPALPDPGKFEALALQALQKLCRDKQIDGQDMVVEANAGLSFHQHGSPLTETFLTDATLALRAAKQKGPKELAVFSPMLRATFESNAEMAKELLSALQAGNILPWFQPQVDIHTGEIVGAEALARWLDNGQVRFPGAFLPAAEEAGYMEQIELAVRDKVLALASTLNETGARSIHLGLNVSASFLEQENVADDIHKKILSLGLKPSNFSLEILEAVMIDEIGALQVKENIARLSDLGFFIELDDFGTGHSSISSLRDLKVDRVKIDRSFISGVDTNPSLQKFTSALINLAKSLDISVLAEGVETEGERLWLMDNGCDVIQGFLISKAVPEDQIIDMVVRQSHLHTRDTLQAVGT